ncbi:SMI1/KNR4 family protein [Streptomyces sp. SP17BM10]|uniref:SMI1/KNR4 family protein n=1 Tax=Streptomyces sp. SP17BM10 TaxID=3002530 RepID=UPI002E773363|nr:SMI1/KNR4 family protein [Streptomyces sp. SP17BM10]MEE1783887.1 SMI1/KNR4 family protein [Streptomyces sp. SP17BM10]
MNDEIFDLRAGMAETLRGREGAWAFVRGFAAYWGEPLGPGDGFADAELDAAQRRLGLRLPAALREAYRLFGRRADLTSSHNTLLTPDELYVLDGALVYQAENQGCAHWGIPLAELAADDPATVARPDLADSSQERWEPWEPRFSVAVVAMAMTEKLLEDHELTDFAEPEDELPRAFRELPRLGRECRWFEGPDVLVGVIEDFAMTARARGAEALRVLHEAVPADWLKG